MLAASRYIVAYIMNQLSPAIEYSELDDLNSGSRVIGLGFIRIFFIKDVQA